MRLPTTGWSPGPLLARDRFTITTIQHLPTDTVGLPTHSLLCLRFTTRRTSLPANDLAEDISYNCFLECCYRDKHGFDSDINPTLLLGTKNKRCLSSQEVKTPANVNTSALSTSANEATCCVSITTLLWSAVHLDAGAN